MTADAVETREVLRLDGVTKRFGALTANDAITLSLRSGCSHCERLRRVVVAVCVRWCLALGLDIPQRRGQQQCKEGRSRGFHGDTLALL